MKKLLIRLAGSVCILAAVATIILTTWVQIGNVSRKDMRSLRKELSAHLEIAESNLTEAITYEEYKDDLKDND